MAGITFLGPTTPQAAVQSLSRPAAPVQPQEAPHPPPTWLGPDVPTLEFAYRPVAQAQVAPAEETPKSYAWVWWLLLAAGATYYVTRK